MKIGIITDIHEDAQRLHIAMSAFEKQNCDFIVCLGDISGFDERYYSYKFSRNLKYCLDCISVNCRIIIPGNHDLFHLRQLPESTSIFNFPENWYNLTFKEKKQLSRNLIWLNEKDEPVKETELIYEIFHQRKRIEILEFGDDRILFSHSISPDISGFLKRKPERIKDFIEHIDLLKINNCNIGIAGHLHPNGLLRIAQGKILKPIMAETEVPKNEIIQYICPCIADGMQDNGYTIFDIKNRIVETFPLRTPRSKMFSL